MTRKDELLSLVDRIPDAFTRAMTHFMLDNAPPHFWVKPSSAGKYHPPDEHGFEGLLLHSIRVAGVGWVICESSLGRLDSSTILSACAIHDICRYGDKEQGEQYTVRQHPELAAQLIRSLTGDALAAVADAVETHTGRWGKVTPRNETEWAVHYADNIAANYLSWSSNGRGGKL